MKGKRVLAAGGAGFIGSSSAEELVRENKVIIVDDLSTGRTSNIKDLLKKENVRFIHGSITEPDCLRKSLSDVDYVFHQVTLPSVLRNIKDLMASNETNITGTLNVL